ncbi:hypothetical protein QUF99_21965 [Bacillus sp. DX4.1]|uniref:hypothetical protein n=1 Tax=Bacillus sp. DX4.1 TaxID=3055867 RepID=UPI0025A0D701|nr:hypothetical protein [Bacillus sp. DX4.1]MDM5189891.1 hypothetical protein [Bacillus sp. DX4.1]
MTTNKSNDSEKKLQPQTNNTIDEKDVIEGIKVEIPAYKNMQAGDTIEIYWGDEWNIEKKEEK